LHLPRTGAIHVIAETPPKEINMTTEETGTTQAAAPDKPKGGKKARVGAQRAHVAPKKAKAAPKAKGPKKAPKRAKVAGTARDGSKAAAVIDLLKRPDGASMKELIKATGWQPHSVRGFLSGAIRKKMGMMVTSIKTDDGERAYSIKP